VIVFCSASGRGEPDGGTVYSAELDPGNAELVWRAWFWTSVAVLRDVFPMNMNGPMMHPRIDDVNRVDAEGF
jgi:hypothetical protein